MTERTLDSFRANHDPHETIKRLEKELAEAQAQVGTQAAIKAALDMHGVATRRKAPAFLDAKLKASDPGTPVLFISDLHWGEVVDPKQIGNTNKYNLSIAHERLHYTVQTAIHLLRILDSGMNYPGITVPLGGDMISGDIHDELSATNALPTIPTLLDLASHLEGAIGLLADTFGHVFLPCVTGNHGRNTRKIWSKNRNHTSFDWLLYQILAKSFSGDDRVTFEIADGPDILFRTMNRRYLLTHGDKLGNGGDGMIGFLGPVTRGDHKRRTRQNQINQPYDTMICGHWHQYVHTQRLIVNGSLKGYDEYAFTEAFPFEEPQQALWVVHPKYGETYRMPVKCEAH